MSFTFLYFINLGIFFFLSPFMLLNFLIDDQKYENAEVFSVFVKKLHINTYNLFIK